MFRDSDRYESNTLWSWSVANWHRRIRRRRRQQRCCWAAV